MADQVKGGILSPFLREKRLAAVRPHLSGAVLDFGCGVGALAPFCAQETYLGVDRDEESIRLARRQNPGYRFATELPESGTFDTIVSLAVIEHIPDPGKLLARLRTLLVPGGRLVLTTPHPAFEWVHELGAKLGLCSADAAEEHETLLDATAMRKLAEQNALRLVTSQRFLFGVNQLFVLRV